MFILLALFFLFLFLSLISSFLVLNFGINKFSLPVLLQLTLRQILTDCLQYCLSSSLWCRFLDWNDNRSLMNTTENASLQRQTTILVSFRFVGLTFFYFDEFFQISENSIKIPSRIYFSGHLKTRLASTFLLEVILKLVIIFFLLLLISSLPIPV